MKTILKFTLQEGRNIALLPMYSEALSVQEQDNNLVLYVLADTDNDVVEEEFEVVGTGYPVESHMPTSQYIGTVMLNKGSFVLHVIHKDVYSQLKPQNFKPL